MQLHGHQLEVEPEYHILCLSAKEMDHHLTPPNYKLYV